MEMVQEADPALDPEYWLGLIDWENVSPEIDEKWVTANRKLLAEHSFLFFAWFYGRKHLTHTIADFQKELMDDLTKMRPGQNSLYLLPRGHGKSTIITFLYTLWNVCYRKKLHIGIVSSTSEQAEKFLGKIATELRTNQLIKDDFGDLSGFETVGHKEVWKARKLRTSNQVILFAMGTGGSIRGVNETVPEDLRRDFAGYDRRGRPIYRNQVSRRPDLLIFDDIIEMKWLKTKRVRDQVENWFLTTAVPALDVMRGNIIMVGTTLHDDDLVSRLYRDKEKTIAWSKLKRPACDGFDKYQNPIKPLWPSYWCEADEMKPLNQFGQLLSPEQVDTRGLKFAQLTDQQKAKLTDAERQEFTVYFLTRLYWKRIEIGSRAFAQEYLLDPLASGMKLFDIEWFRYYMLKATVMTAAQEQTLITNGWVLDFLPEDLIAVTSVDPASSRGQQAQENDSDYSVISTVGYSPRMRRFYVLDVDRVRTTPAIVMQLLLKHYRLYSHEHRQKIVVPGTIGYESILRGHPCEHMGIIVEAVGYQKALAVQLEEVALAIGMYPKIIEVKRGRRDKKQRASAASPIFERNQVYWPCPLLHGLQKDDIDEAMSELDKFPEAEHDDCVDSLVDGLNFLNQMSYSLNRGLAAQVAMKRLIESSPEMYAYATARQKPGMDVQTAMQGFRGRPT